MKYKKSQPWMFGVIFSVVLFSIIVAVLLYQFKGGTSAADKNIANLGSCKNQGGECKEKDKCGPDKTGFYKYGCPEDDDINKENKYCCIPNDRNTIIT